MKSILKWIGRVFVPIIPAFIGVGLIGGIEKFILSLGVPSTLRIMQVIDVIGQAFWGYLILIVAINAAKEVGGPIAMGAVAGSIMLAPGLAALGMVSGRGGVIGALLAGALMGYIHKKLSERVPPALAIVVPATVSVLIGGLAILFVIQPVGGWVSGGMVSVAKSVLNLNGPLAGMLMAALWLPLVVIGFHHALVPVNVQLIASLGATPLMPMFSMAGAGQVGAALAIILCTGSARVKQAARDGLPIGILGIGEPLIYGVTLPLGLPFVLAVIGAAIGGAYVGMTGLAARAVYVSGILAVVTATAPAQYIIAYLIAAVSGFVLTYVAYRVFHFKEPAAE